MKSASIKKLSLTILSLIGVVFLTNLFASTNRWSNQLSDADLLEFQNTVAKRLNNYKSDDNSKFLIRFGNFWSKHPLSENERKEVIEISNLIETKNLAADPYLTAYLNNVMLFYDSTSNVKGYEQWNKGLKRILSQNGFKSDVVYNVITGPVNLASKKCLFANDYIKWTTDSTLFTYYYDTTLYIKLPKGKLVSYCQRDTVKIYETSGISYPLWGIFKGKGGVVNWKKSEYDTSKVFSTLKSYSIRYDQTMQKFDSVLFTNKDLLKSSIPGSLTISYENVATSGQTYYPQFVSYNKSISITNLFDSVNYVGGLALKGRLFIGYGTKNSEAKVTIIKAKKPFIVAQSQTFQLKNDGITSNNASILIRMVKDSIVHNNKAYSFDGKARDLRLTTNSKEILTKAPFRDSYHRIGIMADQLYWKLSSDRMQLNSQVGSNQSDAIFESYNFFNQDMFDELMRRDEQHPVYLIRKYEREIKASGPLTADGFARFIRKPNFETENLLKEMAFLGYIVYDNDSRVFRTTNKMRDAIRARNKQLDYDPILFVSEHSKSSDNAVLDLNTFDLKIYGISQINLSEAKNVRVYPQNNTVTLKYNRDIEFDGEIRAGLTTFKGNGFKFNYDSFTIDIEKVVSMNFDYKTDKYDNTGNPLLNSITSTIENITGVLSIDNPNNKSGLNPSSGYPKFKSKGDSYIYYDDPSIFGGIYSRDKFYFRLYPYEIDSLNSFEKDNLTFKGQMVSAGIFEPFEQTLKVQSDQSLGFVKKMDTQGTPVYGSRGQFFNKLSLSNKGLIGDGTLNFITSSSKAKAIYYFPDSCVSYIDSMKIRRSLDPTEFPNGYTGEHLMKWLPYKDVMNFYASESPFTLYDEKATLKGSLTLKSSGLAGSGNLLAFTSAIRSSDFSFKAYDFDAQISNVDIFDDPIKSKLFAADSVSSHIDFKQNKGKFAYNNTPFKATYPALEFMSYANEVRWDILRKTLAFTSQVPTALPANIADNIKLTYEDKRPSGAVLISTRKEQDSLCFATPSALYSMQQNKMFTANVKHILLGDAALILNQNKDSVIIGNGAKLEEIKSAELFADRALKRYHFHDVNISIGGRNGFNATGNYTYKDKYGKADTIHFQTITLDRDYKTIAYANLDEDDSFFMSPYFRFKGKVTAQSKEKYLQFDGGAKLTHEYKTLAKNWMRFTAEINPDSVMIPITSPYQTVDKVNVYAGTYYRRDSINIYPTFFTGRKYDHDIAMVIPNGFLYYNDQNQSYQLSKYEKIKKLNSAGDMISLYKEPEILVSEGMLSLGIGIGEVKQLTAGRAIHNIKTNELKVSGLLSFDFLFNAESLNLLSADLTASGSSAIDYKKWEPQVGLREFIGDQQAEELIKSFTKSQPLEKMPEQYQHTLLFNDIQLRWDKKSRTFISQGDLGIVSVGSKVINKKVKGFIEFSPNNDHRMYLYLDFGNSGYALFIYTSAGNMFAASSNELFNEAISKTRSSKRSIKSGLWETSYIYNNADERLINIIKTRYNQVKGM